MTRTEEFKDAWRASEPIDRWIENCRENHRKPVWNDLVFKDRKDAAYGYFTLYIDRNTGIYYFDYTSIGD